MSFRVSPQTFIYPWMSDQISMDSIQVWIDETNGYFPDPEGSMDNQLGTHGYENDRAGDLNGIHGPSESNPWI
jgi:hypothetical protein